MHCFCTVYSTLLLCKSGFLNAHLLRCEVSALLQGTIWDEMNSFSPMQHCATETPQGQVDFLCPNRTSGSSNPLPCLITHQLLSKMKLTLHQVIKEQLTTKHFTPKLNNCQFNCLIILFFVQWCPFAGLQGWSNFALPLSSSTIFFLGANIGAWLRDAILLFFPVFSLSACAHPRSDQVYLDRNWRLMWSGVMSELERVVNAAVSGHLMWRASDLEGGGVRTREGRLRTGLWEH